MRGDYGSAQVISKSEVTQSLVLDADQVLVGTNRTRRRYNQRLRGEGLYRRLPAIRRQAGLPPE